MTNDPSYEGLTSLLQRISSYDDHTTSYDSFRWSYDVGQSWNSRDKIEHVPFYRRYLRRPDDVHYRMMASYDANDLSYDTS